MARRGKASNANTTTSGSVTVPVSGIGIQQYDTIIFAVNTGGGSSNTVSFPTGFTAFGTAQNVSNTNTFAAAWKIATASEPSSYVATSSVNDYLTGTVIAYSGRDHSSPIRAVATSPTGQFGSPPTFTYQLANVTANAGDDVLQIFGSRFYDNNSLTYAAQSGFGNSAIDYATSTQYSPPVVSEDWIGYTGGSVGLNAGTLTTSNSNTQGYAGYVIALAQAIVPTSPASYSVTKRFGPGVSPDYLQQFKTSVRGFSRPSTKVSASLNGSIVSMTQGTLSNPTISGNKVIALSGNALTSLQGVMAQSQTGGVPITLTGNAMVVLQGKVMSAFSTSPFTLPYTV